LFYSTEINKCFGLATPEEKNAVSHRYRAIAKMKEFLK
jgi:inosine/xanthosine triphosphate pyrophosphatase family protein